MQNFTDFLVAFLRRKTVAFYGTTETSNVIVKSEKYAVPHAYNVVDDVGATISPVRDRHPSFSYWHELAVHVSGA
jgi:hypothetical protein